MSENADYICLRCSRVNPTCCCLPPGQEKSFFPLSRNEINEIDNYLKGNDFFVRETNDRNFLTRLTKILPAPGKLINERFPLDNFHFRLKTYSDGRCVLLTQKGCMLPVDIRPVYCRLYPFWLHNNRLTFLIDPSCLAQEGNTSLRDLVNLFAVDPNKILQDFNLLLSNFELNS